MSKTQTTSKRAVTLAGLLLLALAGMVIVSTGMGFIQITPGEVVRVIIDRITSDSGLTAGLDPL
ncbi:MAG: hypothetical protein OEL66_02665, partial [Desulfobulbaceae bacterium]|nr:hypothetical protein [Desulfobulbaceae bacterium]